MASSELVLNLWYIIDCHSRLVYAVAGKVYALAGTDQEKTRILKTLATTDYSTAPLHPLPERFHTHGPGGKSVRMTPPAILQEHLTSVFDEVFAAVEASLPPQTAFINGRTQRQAQHLPEEPLFVLTGLMDDDEGGLHPVV